MELRSGFLPVGIEHQLYYEDVGAPDRQPLLFLHGGPGLGCEEKHRTLFDLTKFRVILLDQRGCHRSQPQGCLDDNTTAHLISDIENLRKRLRIDKFCVVGSSWGAVLALGYAAKFPDRVHSLVLKSPFWASAQDREWSYTEQGVARKLGAAWADFSLGQAGAALLDSYAQKLLSGPPDRDAAARWLNWGAAIYFARRPAEYVRTEGAAISDFWLHVARLQVYYARNDFFLPHGCDEFIARIRENKISAICVQGAQDCVTPLAIAIAQKEKWPELELEVLPNADHKIPDQRMNSI